MSYEESENVRTYQESVEDENGYTQSTPDVRDENLVTNQRATYSKKLNSKPPKNKKQKKAKNNSSFTNRSSSAKWK